MNFWELRLDLLLMKFWSLFVLDWVFLKIRRSNRNRPSEAVKSSWSPFCSGQSSLDKHSCRFRTHRQWSLIDHSLTHNQSVILTPVRFLCSVETFSRRICIRVWVNVNNGRSVGIVSLRAQCLRYMDVLTVGTLRKIQFMAMTFLV